MNAVLIDNFDSFTFNLRELIRSSSQGMGLSVTVIRSNELLERVQELSPVAIFISPGPGRPHRLSLSYKVIDFYHQSIPILGVCLGMQFLNEYFGGETVHAPLPVHGKVNLVSHSESSLFQNIASPIRVARYHSLMIKASSEFDVTMSCEGVPMAISHKKLPLYGLQFHPESFLSSHGTEILKNFFRLTYLFDRECQF